MNEAAVATCGYCGERESTHTCFCPTRGVTYPICDRCAEPIRPKKLRKKKKNQKSKKKLTEQEEDF
jgi:hypothetical protein